MVAQVQRSGGSYQFLITTCFIIGIELWPCVVEWDSLVVDLFMSVDPSGVKNQWAHNYKLEYLRYIHTNVNLR